MLCKHCGDPMLCECHGEPVLCKHHAALARVRSASCTAEDLLVRSMIL